MPALLLAACSNRSSTTTPGEATGPPTPSMKFEPANSTADVVPTAPVGVEVSDGWFQRVTLTNPEGRVVAGCAQP